MIEVIFRRSYYLGRDFGVPAEGHLRLRWSEPGGRDDDRSDPWPRLGPALDRAYGGSASQPGLATVQRPSAERILDAAWRIGEALGEPVTGGTVYRHDDGVTADLRLAMEDSMVAEQALQLAVIAANNRVDHSAPVASEESAAMVEFLAGALSRLAEVAGSRRADRVMAALIAAADERRIPHIRFDRWPFLDAGTPCPEAVRGVLQLGEGRFQQRLRGGLLATAPRTTLERLADNVSTWVHLYQLGLPVAARDRESPHVVTMSRARRAARRLGYPLVIKPRLRSHGAGLTTDIADERALVEAVKAARSVSPEVIVERQATGETWRLLLIDGAVVAAHTRSAPGDDRLDQLHPGSLAMALRAVGGLALRVATVDMVLADPSAQPTSGNACVLGIDPGPDLNLFRQSGEGIPLRVARRLVSALFPPGTPATVPKVAITGTNGKTTTAHMVAAILQRNGGTVGLTSTNGRFINGALVVQKEASGVRGAIDTLLDRRIDVAVLETARGELVHKGLAFHDVTVAACTNIAHDHIGIDGIDSLDQMAAHKRQVVETATECAVLNADDQRCLAMRPHLRARHCCLFSRNADSAVIRHHVDAGGVALVLGRHAGRATMLLHDRGTVVPLLTVDEMPASWHGRALHNVENALCAAALAYTIGVPPSVITQALRELETTVEMIPGRLNRIPGLPFDVIVDAAHNAHGIAALAAVIRNLPRTGGQRTLLFFAREEDSSETIDATVREVVNVFDLFICRDSMDASHSEPGTCATALASGLRRASVDPARIQVIADRQAAMSHALNHAAPGDLLVICTVWPATTLDELREEIARHRELQSNSGHDG